MPTDRDGRITRRSLLEYFERGAVPRDRWMVGMELEKMGRDTGRGEPIPYNGPTPSVREVLELILAERGGNPIFEANHLIGLDADWGSISLEPGGQVEWSSRPAATLARLERSLTDHLDAMRSAERVLGLRWLDEAVDPDLPVEAMTWMPKARYKIMRDFLGARGSLAHRMMTQTASIQCAFDYADAEDWRRKFKAAATLSPVATALFANSSRIDGGESGFRSYRQAIWSKTDPARCGMPACVFDAGFDIGRWLDWVIDVPTIFRYRARGLVPSGAVPFRSLMELRGCDELREQDWELHASTVFTDVRSYTYIEVRSADLQPDRDAFVVPAFWTGLLYRDDSLRAALELTRPFDDAERWNTAMHAAARHGLDARPNGTDLRELAERVVALSLDGIDGGAACAGEPGSARDQLVRLAERHQLEPVD